jgi:hypothetical protein
VTKIKDIKKAAFISFGLANNVNAVETTYNYFLNIYSFWLALKTQTNSIYVVERAHRCCRGNPYNTQTL